MEAKALTFRISVHFERCTSVYAVWPRLNIQRVPRSQEAPTPPGTPEVLRHGATEGSQGEVVSCEQGTRVNQSPNPSQAPSEPNTLPKVVMILEYRSLYVGFLVHPAPHAQQRYENAHPPAAP